MLKKHRGLVIAGIIMFAAFLVGLYGFSVGSYYKESIVIAYGNLYADAMEYVKQLIAFLRESLGVTIKF